MKTVTLVDTRQEIAGGSIGTVVSTHDTILAAFKASDEFQSRMRASGVKCHLPTKIVTLKVRLSMGEHVNPAMHLFLEGENVDGLRGEKFTSAKSDHEQQHVLGPGSANSYSQ